MTNYIELLAGNVSFAEIHRFDVGRLVINDQEKSTIVPHTVFLPTALTDYFEFCLPQMRAKLKLLTPFYTQPEEQRPTIFRTHPIPTVSDCYAMAVHGQPHTVASLKRLMLSKEYPILSEYLEVMFKSGNKRIIHWMTTVDKR